MPKGRWSFVRESLSILTLYSVPTSTGPLDSFAGKSVTVLADLENLLIGVRQLECELSLSRLGKVLQKSCSSCRLLGFITPGKEENDLPSGLGDIADWELVRNESAGRKGSRERSTNCDNLILFHAGSLLKASPSDVVIVGSGDGNLVCSLTRFIRSANSSIELHSLSVAGSSSNRIDAFHNPDIAGNILLGFDCLRPKAVFADHDLESPH